MSDDSDGNCEEPESQSQPQPQSQASTLHPTESKNGHKNLLLVGSPGGRYAWNCHATQRCHLCQTNLFIAGYEGHPEVEVGQWPDDGGLGRRRQRWRLGQGPPSSFSTTKGALFRVAIGSMIFQRKERFRTMMSIAPARARCRPPRWLEPPG